MLQSRHTCILTAYVSRLGAALCCTEASGSPSAASPPTLRRSLLSCCWYSSRLPSRSDTKVTSPPSLHRTPVVRLAKAKE